ncbi:MAG TPA: DUF3553 domain-containing protein, partial [Geobacteraceae bacterium]
GDMVRHPAMPVWGVGKVMKIVQGGNLLVSFAGGGKRLLHPGYAPLEKVPDDELLYLVIREARPGKGRPKFRVRVIPIVRTPA